MTKYTNLKVGMVVSTKSFAGVLYTGKITGLGPRKGHEVGPSAVWAVWGNSMTGNETYFSDSEKEYTIISSPDDGVIVGKKYRPLASKYERTIIFKDERSVVFEEKNGTRNLCNLSSTKDWIEILPEDWRVLYRNSAGDILVSKTIYTNRTAALDDQDHYHEIIDVIRVDDKRPTIQPSA